MLCCSSAVGHSSKATDPETSILAMTELDLLKKPEYIHVVLNHLPIYGTILGALALAISLILRSRAAQITALILTLVAGGVSIPGLRDRTEGIQDNPRHGRRRRR